MYSKDTIQTFVSTLPNNEDLYRYSLHCWSCICCTKNSKIKLKLQILTQNIILKCTYQFLYSKIFTLKYFSNFFLNFWYQMTVVLCTYLSANFDLFFGSSSCRVLWIDPYSKIASLHLPTFFHVPDFYLGWAWRMWGLSWRSWNHFQPFEWRLSWFNHQPFWSWNLQTWGSPRSLRWRSQHLVASHCQNHL